MAQKQNKKPDGRSGSHHERVDVDEDQAGSHDQVRHQREGRQILQVGGENQQDEGGQEAEHVEAGVEARHQDLRLVGVVGVAVEGGGVGRFHHLGKEESQFERVKDLTRLKVCD